MGLSPTNKSTEPSSQQPVSLSKILPPRLYKVLDRPRLIERLRQHKNKKLILIVGQAAQGKSTLAASYVNALERTTAWINLDHDDSDAANLFNLLVQSLQRTFPNLDLSPLHDCAAIALGPRKQVPLYRDWAQSLFQSISGTVQLVFDGLDHLAPDASAFRFLQVMIHHVPENIRLMMLSREMPSFDIQALKIRQDAFVLTNEELSFTFDEMSEFFRKVRRFSFAAAALRRIYRATEGWIGGLILLSESLSQGEFEGLGTTILSELPDHLSKEVFRYFAEEIFTSQTYQVRDFLIKSSILESIEPCFVRDLLGVTNAGEILTNLERRNLFTQSAYERKKIWLFRYHQLFRDFLQDRFATELDDETRQSLYTRAGVLYEHRGELENALKYYIQAKAHPQVELIVESLGMGLLRRGRTGDLAKWLGSLPEDLVQANPWLLFYSYMTGRFTGSQEYLHHLLKALMLFEQREDTRGVLLSLAHLVETSTTGAHPSLLPMHTLLARGEALLSSLPHHQYLYERTVLWSQIGFAHYLRSGDPRKGYRACHNACLLAVDLGDASLQLNALIHAYASLSVLGEFSKIPEILQQVDKLLETCPNPELRVHHLIHSVQLHLFEGDFQTAGEVLRKARGEIERHGLSYFNPTVLLYEIWLKQNLGEYDGAVEIAKGFADLTLAMGNMFLHGNALFHSGLSLYRKGDFRAAKDFLRHARNVFSSEEGRSDLHLNLVGILSGLIAYHLREEGDHEKDIEKALQHFQQIASYLFLKEAHLAMALHQWQEDRLEEAARHLRAGIGIARQRGNHEFLLLGREDILRVCLLALEWQLDGASDFAARLLTTRLAVSAAPELERLARHTNKQIAETAREILRAIHRAATPPLRIQTLGGFRVYRDAAPIEEKAWPSNQPKLLLKSIVAHGPRWVPKDLVMEALWPDRDPSAVDGNFKVNLHRLRRVLEPAIDKGFGSSYVHLKANLISLDEELCRVDAEEFVSLYEKGKEREKAGDMPGAISFYEEAMLLYQGDFLPEERYWSWADLKREELRETYVGLLYRMAELLEKQGRTVRKPIDLYRKIIATDPLHEPSYQRLMTLYAGLGRQSAAVRIYQECCTALRDGVNTAPDPVTTSIYRKFHDPP